jgi:hypothetical protein
MESIIDIVPGRDAGHVAGPFPSEVSITEQDYVGYFRNEYGEELVFVRQPGVAGGTLYHSDVGWEPVAVNGPPRLEDLFEGRLVDPNGRPRTTPTAGEGEDRIILNLPEALWLAACWQATSTG